MLIVFLILFILSLLVLLFMDGYARHMGSPGPSDWVAMIVVAAISAACTTGIGVVIWEVVKLLWGLVS